jgi:hypothetical protein
VANGSRAEQARSWGHFQYGGGGAVGSRHATPAEDGTEKDPSLTRPDPPGELLKAASHARAQPPAPPAPTPAGKRKGGRGF